MALTCKECGNAPQVCTCNVIIYVEKETINVIDMPMSTIFIWPDGLWMFEHEYTEEDFAFLSDDFFSHELAGEWEHDDICNLVNNLNSGEMEWLSLNPLV